MLFGQFMNQSFVGVSFPSLLGRSACVACLALDLLDPQERRRLDGQDLGLAEDLSEVPTLRVHESGLGQHLLELHTL